DHQCAGDPLPPAVGVHRQSVDVPPPAVKRPDDRADDSAPDFGHKDVGRAFGDGPPKVVGGVGHAGRGVGLPPQVDDHFDIFQPARANGQTIRTLLGHHRLQQQDGWRGFPKTMAKKRGGGSLHPHGGYSTASVMTPEPTVLPPSRMAKWLPMSRATGLSRRTPTVALSPGRTISIPSGRRISPVTFVVLKKNCGL